VNRGDGMKFPKWFRYYFRYVLPILLLAIFVSGMVTYFQ